MCCVFASFISAFSVYTAGHEASEGPWQVLLRQLPLLLCLQSLHQQCRHKCLATKAPLVVAQWRCEANAGLPASLAYHSVAMLAWVTVSGSCIQADLASFVL